MSGCVVQIVEFLVVLLAGRSRMNHPYISWIKYEMRYNTSLNLTRYVGASRFVARRLAWRCDEFLMIVVHGGSFEKD